MSSYGYLTGFDPGIVFLIEPEWPCMEVKLFANLAETANARSVDIDLEEEIPVEEVLFRLFEQHPSLRHDILDGDRVQDHISILVNGRTLPPAEALAESVGPDDEVAIFPPVSGGTV